MNPEAHDNNHNELVNTDRQDKELRQRKQQEDKGKKYKVLSSEEIKNRIDEFKGKYPDFVKVTTSQEQYGLPKAGGPDDCPFDSDGNPGCNNYVLTIQDYKTHPEGSESSNRLPEVLLSGSLHGNERVGPSSVIELADILLSVVNCESSPHVFDKDMKKDDISNGQLCRNQLDQDTKQINSIRRKWLSRLVSTRRIVIVPTANALGYYRNIRTEGDIDPNRDFPYDLLDSSKCMQTIAGRTLNEIFQEHMFQLSLTFHAGMEVIAYEWGAPSYLEFFSPDDEGQKQIAAGYSKYAQRSQTIQKYDVGTMNDKVYYVRGGMEDWAYAASWDPDHTMPCTPTQFGGYPKEKTTYNNSTLRVFNMLVEASNFKTPRDNQLGTDYNVLSLNNVETNGHIARNMRLALMAIDMVEPYVNIVAVDDFILSDDIIPQQQRNSEAAGANDFCFNNMKKVLLPKNLNKVTIEWTVGGAFTIDDTSLYYGNVDNIFSSDSKFKLNSNNCLLVQPDPNLEKEENGDDIEDNSFQSGTGMFSAAGSKPHPSESKTFFGTKEELEDISFDADKLLPTYGPIFTSEIDLSQYKAQDKIVVLAKAKVDQSWSEQPKTIKPNIPPQSHVVNARTNTDWHHESAGKIIQGRKYWYSTIPLIIEIGDYDDSVGTSTSTSTTSGEQIRIIETSNRFGHTTGSTYQGGITPKKEDEHNSKDNIIDDEGLTEIPPESSSSSSSSMFPEDGVGEVDEPSPSSSSFHGVLVIALMVFAIIATFIYYKRKRQGRGRNRYGKLGGGDDSEAEFVDGFQPRGVKRLTTGNGSLDYDPYDDDDNDENASYYDDIREELEEAEEEYENEIEFATINNSINNIKASASAENGDNHESDHERFKDEDV